VLRSPRTVAVSGFNVRNANADNAGSVGTQLLKHQLTRASALSRHSRPLQQFGASLVWNATVRPGELSSIQ
jgi:hypothetical protein